MDENKPAAQTLPDATSPVGKIHPFSKIVPLFTNYASQCQGQLRDKQGQGRDKQGQAVTNRDIPFLSLSVHACPCLSLSVPVCPCLSLSVPVCLFICFTLMSTPLDEYNSLHHYEHIYIDFPCKSHCSNASQPCF